MEIIDAKDIGQRIAERDGMCVVEECTNKGKHKFFGRSICGSHKNRIPGPLEVHAAPWIKAGEHADIINEGLERIFMKREACKEIKGNITTPIVLMVL